MLQKLWNNVKKNRIYQYALLLMVVLVGYLPFTFLVYSPDHDFLNCWVPWRYFISSSIEQGYFPWWNPYQQLGYPIHADLQGPLWYPENLLSSYLGIQSIPYLIYVYLTHLWIGAIAIFELSKWFGAQLKAALLMGSLYVFTGFFLGHSMHQYAVYSAAWIPLLFYLFLQMLQTGKMQYVFWSAFVMFFNLTGGNHTFTIIAIYLFGLVWVYYLVQNKTDSSKLKKQLINTGLYAIACLSVGTLVLVLTKQITPYIGRLQHMHYADAAFNPFSPQSLWSFINPNININTQDFFATDQTMSNGYISLLGLILLALTFFRKRTKLENYLLIFAGLSLLCAFGDYLPFHKTVFNWFPMMDKFRFPSYFIFFTIFLILPILAKTLSAHLEKPLAKAGMVIKLLIGVLVLQVVYGVSNWSEITQTFSAYNASLFELKKIATLPFNAFVFGNIGLVFGLLYLRFYKTKWLFAVVAFEVISVLPFAYTHTTMVNINPSIIQNAINEHERPFDKLSLDPIKDHNYNKDQMPFLWKSGSVVLKNVTNEGFNSFWFWDLYMLEDSIPNYAKILYKNPVAFASNKTIEVEKVGSEIGFDSSYTALQITDYEKIKNYLKNDSLIQSIQVEKINGEGFEFTTKTNTQSVLNLIQSYYPGWEVSIDGQPTELFKTNFMCMGVLLPNGKHKVTFLYKNPTVVYAAIFSYSAWGVCFFLALFFRKRDY